MTGILTNLLGLFQKKPQGPYGIKRVKAGAAIVKVDQSAYDENGRVVLPSVVGERRVVALGAWLFEDCVALKDVVIPEGVLEIGDGAFDGCTALSSVELPEGVVRIGRYAFDGATSLTNIRIPASVREIGLDAFARSAVAVDVDRYNEWYSSESGVLFDKWKSTLIHFPTISAIREYAIPKTVREIDECAFEGASSLVSVAIPGSVKTIGNAAFLDCSSLAKVELAEGVEIIDEGAFDGCFALTRLVIPTSVSQIEDPFYKCPAVLVVRKGSYAESWARREGREFEIVEWRKTF